jgi:hypothetical protein
MLVITLLAAALASPVPVDTLCIWNRSSMPGRAQPINMPDERRQSPRDSVSFQVGGAAVKVCYSRPSARGRTMIGGEAIPYGRLWRTGANEATMLIATGDLMVAGVHVPAGIYSLYTVPGEREWEVIVNRSYMQWGHESAYTDSVRAMEVGRGRVPVQAVAAPIEQFTIRAEPLRGRGAMLVLEWERSRVAIPVQRM